MIGGGNMGAALLGGHARVGRVRAGVARSRREAGRPTRPARRAVPRRRGRGGGPAVRGGGDRGQTRWRGRRRPRAVAAGARRVLSIAAGVTLARRSRPPPGRVSPWSVRCRTRRRWSASVPRRSPAGRTATDDDLAWAEAILGSVGIVERLDEASLDAFTGVAGSGPAYVFLFAEALTDAAVAEGIEPDGRRAGGRPAAARRVDAARPRS